MLPNGWSELTLGAISKFLSGGTPSKQNSEFWDGDLPWISGKDLKEHYLSSSIDRLTDEGFKNANVAPKGSVLVLVRGMTLLKDFPVGYATRDVAFNQDIKAIIPKDNIDSLFLSYYLYLKKEDIKSLVSVAGHGTGRLDTDSLKEFIILTPPLPEQIKIAEILSTWDKAINTVQKLLSNSQQQKKALMQQLLTGKKRFSGFEGEWEVYLLEDLESMGWVELGRGNVISKKDIEKKQGLYPIYSSSVKNLGLMGFYDEFMFDEELISWSIDGGGNFFYRPKHKFSVTNVSGYMRLDGTKLSYRFMANQLELLHSKLEFDYQSKAHPSVIRKLYKIYLPELQEQQKIAAVLTTADQEIDNLCVQLNHLKQEKKALMQQLLTGKRRVKIEEAA